MPAKTVHTNSCAIRRMTMSSEVMEKIASGLNDAQKKAVLNPVESCTKIVAGAGTGKTKIISKRFVKLVFDLINQGIENPQSKILVITFTDKAANEMKGRILQELEENNIPVLNSQDLWISTFHSFCMRILKKYSIEAGLSPSFKMGEEQQLKTIYDNLVKFIKYGEITSLSNIDSILENAGLDKNVLDIHNLAKLNKINEISLQNKEFIHFLDLVQLNNFSFRIGFDTCCTPALLRKCQSVLENSLDFCEAARFSMYIDSELNAYPCSFDCDRGDFKVNMQNSTIKEVWDSEVFNQFRNIQIDSCSSCLLKNKCVGKCKLNLCNNLCSL